MSPSWASLILLAGLICGIIFLGGAHRSATRLFLLFGLSAFSGAMVPAIRSILGPGPGLSATGEMVIGSDGKPMYTMESMHYWSTITAVDDAIMILSGFVFLISAILLIVRAVTWFQEKRDAVV